MGLKYVGPDITLDSEVAYGEYVTGVKSADLSSAAIDTVIDNGLANYAAKTYADNQDALLATTAYIDGQDNLRVKTSAKDIPNGVAGLSATTGKLLPARINAPLTQRYVRGPWTPSAYNAAPLNVTDEATLYTCPVTDPGYPYKLIVFTEVDVRTSLATEYPLVKVRVGSATGEVVAAGDGLADDAFLPFTYTDNFDSGFNSAKWATIPGSNVPNFTVASGSVAGQNGVVQASQWNGDQPSGDDLVLKFPLRNLAFGDLRVMLHANPAWNNYFMCNMSRASFGATLIFYTGTNADLQSGFTQRGPTINIGATDNGYSDGQIAELRYASATKKYEFYLNGNGRLDWSDSTNILTRGANHRRWGFLTNASAGTGSFTGMGFDDVNYVEPGSNPMSATVLASPTGLASQTVKTGSTTLYVRVARSASAATIIASEYRPRMYVMAVAA